MSSSGFDSFDASAKKAQDTFNTVIIVSVVLTVVGLIIAGVAVFLFFKWLNKQKFEHGLLGAIRVQLPAVIDNHPPGSQANRGRSYRNEGDPNPGAVGVPQEEMNFSGLPVAFTFRELEMATNNFSNSELLGKGGFGSVYKGKLKTGDEVAVKRLNRSGDEKGFCAEVVTLGTLVNHRNVVRLRGYCAEGQHRLLVYSFMSRGSLDSWLFAPRQQQQQSASDSRSDSQQVIAAGSNVAIEMIPAQIHQLRPGRPLPWSVRMQIALGSAKGLAYLHHECDKCIIHLDIKPQNILLDDKWNPKVADFGLAKLMNLDETKVETRPQGTRGYMAPEWLSGQAAGATPKMDVYSLGIVFLELLSGRRVWDAELIQFGGLRLWAMELVRQGRDLVLVDPRLNGVFDEEQMKRMIDVSLWCVQLDPSTRPPMNEVVQMMEQPRVVISRPPLDPQGVSTPPALDWSDSAALRNPETPWSSSASDRSANPLLPENRQGFVMPSEFRLGGD